MSNNIKFRHEFKYYINYFEHEVLRRKLGNFLQQDRNSDKNGNYHIRSLYFDDYLNTALYEKQSGTLSRVKFRIRVYNLNDEVIKLEKKGRRGQFIYKESAHLTRREYDLILGGDYSFLMRSSSTVLNEFYFNIKSMNSKPIVIVDYVREAYISDINNIRITFDKELRTGLNLTDIFNKGPTVDVMEEPKMILEIKYDHFLPDYLRQMLQISSSQRYAISKYVICRKYTKQNNWEDN